jgi:multidrug efflux pump subunit AcrA (membrane-fusion protein)
MTTDTTPDTTTNANKRRAVLLGITGVFALGAIAYGAYATLVLSQRAETDNAYVGGNLVSVSSQVAGSVVEIRADETQMVQAGAEIVRLDPSDAEVALTQAEARLGAAVREQPTSSSCWPWSPSAAWPCRARAKTWRAVPRWPANRSSPAKTWRTRAARSRMPAPCSRWP